MVYRANPASGHGIVTLHDRYVTIPCPALMTGVYKNTIESMHGVDLHLGFYDPHGILESLHTWMIKKGTNKNSKLDIGTKYNRSVHSAGPDG